METQNKLSIEHIAKRLPYGLIFQPSINNSENGLEKLFYLSDKYKKVIFKVNGYNSSDIKLILFPMKCIMDNVVVNGEERCFHEFFGLSEPNEFNDYHKYTNEQWLSVPFFRHEYEELLKFHFDTDNLIEKGIAISVLELTENPYA